MTELIDARGRWILRDEYCKFCGTSSTRIHPAGVVPGRWLCSCGRKQHERDIEDAREKGTA